MKYYKIVDSKLGHHGIFYKEGRNADPLSFNPTGDCESGGIYFSREDIFAFLDYGDELYEVTPIGKIYKNPGRPNKWKCKEIDLKYIGKINDLKIIKYLIEDGADIHICNDFCVRYFSEKGFLNIVKYLLKLGSDICIKESYCLCFASKNGHLEVVKYLVENGVWVNARNDLSFRFACENGHLEVVKYLVSKGANINAKDLLCHTAIHYAEINSHNEIVKFLKSCE